MQDSIRHGTFNFISRPGINHLKSKFNERQIIEIRTHIKEGIKTNVEIGKMYGVHNSTISKIRTGAHWKTNK